VILASAGTAFAGAVVLNNGDVFPNNQLLTDSQTMYVFEGAPGISRPQVRCTSGSLPLVATGVGVNVIIRYD